MPESRCTTIRHNSRFRRVEGGIFAARAMQTALGMNTRIAWMIPPLVFAACHRTAPPQPLPPKVEVADVMQIDVQMRRQWVATLDGFVNADIRPQVEGYVRKQAYRDGAYVQRGDVLFLIDPRNYQAALDNAKSTLAHNGAALEKARLDVKRDRALIAGKFIPQKQLDNDIAAEREAEANVGSARAALAQAELNHGWTQVTSPLSGIAGIAQKQVGSLVSTSTVMTTVSQVDPIKAQFNVSELEYLTSAKGTQWAEPAHCKEAVLAPIVVNGRAYTQGGAA